jgi:hypothetical protein
VELAIDDLPTAVALAERVAPVTLARERTLPFPASLVGLVPEDGLVRGQSMSCAGPSATSLALAIAAPTIAEGGWLALIDLPAIGLDAASEYGIPLERVVRVDVSGDVHRWADVVAAAADGFEVLMVRVPSDVTPTTMRKVANRVRQRGAVIIALGDPGNLVCDMELRVDTAVWDGVTDGAGHLQQRRITVRSSGRRMPGRCRREVVLPTPSVPACEAR